MTTEARNASTQPDGVPDGRFVDLGSRGRMFIRESPGPPGAPAIVLLHGWLGTGATNWYRAFPVLERQFRVIAPDQRGHGQGLRSSARFNLAECADDIGALLEALELRDVVLVGYSMGGPIAQLVWRAHPQRLTGLVFCSTASRFVSSSLSRLAVTTAVPALARASGSTAFAARLPWGPFRNLVPNLGGDGDVSVARWAGGEVRSHSLRHVIEAGVAIGTFDSESWIGRLALPTAVVVTTKDRAVDPAAQLRLAHRIKSAKVFPVADGHLGVLRPEFCVALLAACADVHARAARARSI